MPPRKKSSFENFFSLKRHRRRLSRIAVNAPKAEFSVLKEQIVDAGKPNQTRGSHDDLDRHFESLHSEFSGQSALILEHARLNVLLWRQISPKETYARLAELYRLEAPYLLEHLNVRWMVSANGVAKSRYRSTCGILRNRSLLGARVTRHDSLFQKRSFWGDLCKRSESRL